MALPLAAPNLQLPWSSAGQDSNRFYKILLILLVPFLILSIAIPLIDVPEPERSELEELPPQLARVQLEEEEVPPPPPPPEPEPEEEEEAEEEKPEEPEPEEIVEEEKPKEPEPVEEPEPAQLIDEAREVAEAEINQFADALSDMRESFDLSDVNADELTQSTGEAEEIDRSVISSGAKAASGGIKVGKASKNTGGVALSGKKNTKVSSKLADAAGKATKAKKAPRSGSFRSDEDIRKIMDRNKGAIDAIYNRALRKNPTLEGKVVFKLVINKTGKVISASIVSSDLGDKALERKLLARIRLINFGPKEVLETTLNYSFDFLPY